MGTLYINQEDAFIGKVDERLHVKNHEKKLLDVPLIHLDGVVILGRVTISAIQILIQTGKMPPANYSKRCQGCSLYAQCLPQAADKLRRYQEAS